MELVAAVAAILSLAVAAMGVGCLWLAYKVVKTKADDKNGMVIGQWASQVIDAYLNGIEAGKPSKKRTVRMPLRNLEPSLPGLEEVVNEEEDHARPIEGEGDLDEIAGNR